MPMACNSRVGQRLREALFSFSMARDYDAILLDLDGTILTPDETIHPETRAALKEAQDAGVTVMVATGRSKISGMPIVEDLGLQTPVIFFNGCAIWDTEKGRMVEERTISNRTNRNHDVLWPCGMTVWHTRLASRAPLR